MLKHHALLASITVLALSTYLVGCGGDDDESASTEPAPMATQETASSTATKKKAAPKRQTKSTLDRIDAALDAGNYMAAVDIAVKSGKTASENMNNLRYVQEELGDPMARGDRKAHEAYKKLNAFYIMRHQR